MYKIDSRHIIKYQRVSAAFAIVVRVAAKNAKNTTNCQFV